MIAVQVRHQDRLHGLGSQPLPAKLGRDMTVRQAGVKDDGTAADLREKRQDRALQLPIGKIRRPVLLRRPDKFGHVGLRLPVKQRDHVDPSGKST